MTPDDILDSADLNGNGTIDKSEFTDMMQSAKEFGFEKPTNKSFEELDGNKDGEISKDELLQQ